MINPVFLHMGPLTIYYQGLLLALGVFFGTFLFWRRAREDGFSEEKILDLCLVSLVSGVVGAWLFFILLNFSVFRGNWVDIFRSFGSGLNFFGGFAFGAVAFYLFSKRQDWSVLKLADLVTPALVLGQIFGSVGVLVSRLVVPTITAQIISYMVLFVLILVVERQRFFNLFGSVRVGLLTSLYLVGTGLIGFIFDFYNVYTGENYFTFQKVTSFLILVLGVVLGYRSLKHSDEDSAEVSPDDISKQLRDWLYRERGEIGKESAQLRRGDGFFREGRADENAEVGDEAEELISHEYAETMSQFLRRFGNQIDKALDRLRRGNYRECEKCGRRINVERLRAFPAATMCKECAEVADRINSPA